MAKQTIGMAKTFTADSGVTAAGVCVVMSGSVAGNVAMPGAALATKIVGVTQEGIPSNSTTSAISVQISGIAQVQSDGSAVVTAGDFVAIANSSGQVKTIVPASGTNLRQLVGIAVTSAPATAGSMVDVMLAQTVYIGA